MSETRSSSRPSLWFAVVAVIAAAAVWATVAMAAGGSNSSGVSSSPVASYDGPHSMFAADGEHPSGDCPNMGGDSGGSSGGGSTAPTTPSTQDGSANPSL